MQRPSPCDTLGFPPPSHSALFFSISTLHTSVPPLGSIHLASIPKLPPLVPLTNFLHSFAWSQDFTSGLLTDFCIHLSLVSVSKLPPLSLNNFLRSSGFNIYLPPCASHQTKLPAFIGFQYLYFRRSLPIPSCVHFVLISKLPLRCPTTTSCIHLASISPVPLSNFLHSCLCLLLKSPPPWPPTKVPPTCASPQLPAFMRFQYLSFPSSLHSFLHAPSFGFNI